MQYHLNGFAPGNPAISPPADDIRKVPASDRSDRLPDEVDVLIVGCGPAGLTLAAQLAAFPSIKTRIVEQKLEPLRIGQADGVACRSMEMFEAFGFCERVMKEAYWVNETSFWQPDDAEPDMIVRANRIQDVEDGLSEFPHTILSQARVHDFFLESMRNSPRRLEPDYGRRFCELTIASSDGSEHPVHVTLERVDPGHVGEVETLRARYVVGCDGARSAVRRSVGLALHGDSANKIWGVMDVLAVTDFPDIRLKAAIQSAGAGSVLIIPREGGYMFRMYTELGELGENERAADREITPEQIIATAQAVMRPYTLEVKEIAWWSVYEIGQRLADSFDDVPDGERESRIPRVLITGDACHTHSPKAGQGMNVSMADSFNLGWKLASVLSGRAVPELLHTYSSERQTVAKELIDFDRDMAKLFSGRGQGGVDDPAQAQADFQRYFARHLRYTAGVETNYPPSMISAEPTHQHLATGMIIGKRFHSPPVIRLADAKPVHLGHTVKADGRWRVFLFAGDGDPTSELAPICEYLEHDPASPVRRCTPAASDIDSVIDVRAVVQQYHRELTFAALPALLRPVKGRLGLVDYEKVFCPDFKGGEHVFDTRGIDRANGCIVVVRPDQYVANVLPLDAHQALAGFFESFLITIR